jgi:isocitrate dehydrogenase
MRSAAAIKSLSHQRVGAFSAVRALSATPKIVYTETDEAPMLATYSLLPVVKKFANKASISVEKSDISLSGRILAQFPDRLTANQKVTDQLAQLGDLCKTPDANIIKLPNISASVPQLNGAIAELREKGFNVPLYNPAPQSDEDKAVAAAYAKVLGSAVNPVLREGNSDRRVAAPVKNYAKKNPHKLGAWRKSSSSHVSYMNDGDFYGNEQSYVMPRAGSVRIEHVQADGTVTMLKDKLKLKEGEVIDATFLSVSKFRAFIEQEIEEAKADNVLFSVHLKATMMKISDPIMFGHVVSVFFKPVMDKHAASLKSVGFNPNKCKADLYEKVSTIYLCCIVGWMIGLL